MIGVLGVLAASSEGALDLLVWVLVIVVISAVILAILRRI